MRSQHDRTGVLQKQTSRKLGFVLSEPVFNVWNVLGLVAMLWDVCLLGAKLWI